MGCLIVGTGEFLLQAWRIIAIEQFFRELFQWILKNCKWEYYNIVLSFAIFQGIVSMASTAVNMNPTSNKLYQALPLRFMPRHYTLFWPCGITPNYLCCYSYVMNGENVCACAVWISNRIVQAVTRSSNSRIRTKIEKGNVITGAGKVEHRLIRLICYSPCCDNWTSIRPSVGSKRQHSYECHCYQKSSHWWVPHDHGVSTAARLCTWTTELAGDAFHTNEVLSRC